MILWRERFRQGGPDGLTKIAPGRGRPVTYNADRVKQIIEATTQSKPPGATHWSTRTMAKAQGVSKATVQRIGLTKIAPGRGRPVTYNADRVKQIIEATTQSKPPHRLVASRADPSRHPRPAPWPAPTPPEAPRPRRRAGPGEPGDKMMTLVASALAGGDCIDDADVLRAGGTARVLVSRLRLPPPWAPSCAASGGATSVNSTG